MNATAATDGNCSKAAFVEQAKTHDASWKTILHTLLELLSGELARRLSAGPGRISLGKPRAF